VFVSKEDLCVSDRSFVARTLGPARAVAEYANALSATSLDAFNAALAAEGIPFTCKGFVVALLSMGDESLEARCSNSWYRWGRVQWGKGEPPKRFEFHHESKTFVVCFRGITSSEAAQLEESFLGAYNEQLEADQVGYRCSKFTAG
jgi:hypothetical protein